LKYYYPILVSSSFFGSRASKVSNFVSGLRDGSAFQLQLKDRVSAGKVLGMVLKTVIKKKKKGNDILVLGIPRGGVIVADVVAEKLNADILFLGMLRSFQTILYSFIYHKNSCKCSAPCPMYLKYFASPERSKKALCDAVDHDFSH
jgi:hypothetical protein